MSNAQKDFTDLTWPAVWYLARVVNGEPRPRGPRPAQLVPMKMVKPDFSAVTPRGAAVVRYYEGLSSSKLRELGMPG